MSEKAYHDMYLSTLDFGDSLRIIACVQCGRSICVEVDENKAFMWETLEIVNQGDFHAMHRFWQSEHGTNFSMSVEVEDG